MNPYRKLCAGGFTLLELVRAMSDNYEEFCNAHSTQNRVCGVAYTLNDKQPVICTHIGDQPLYYMDDEVVEEEELFDAAELGLLAQEIQTLKDEINALDNGPSFDAIETPKTMEDFSLNADSLNADFTLSEDQQDQRLKEIKDILSESRVAAAYLNTTDKYNVEIKMSKQVEKAFYDRRSGTILVNSDMDLNDQILLVSRELRRHWQHRQGALINPLMFQPEHAIMINRAQEADLAVSVIRTAWELQLAGIRDVWERVENSPMADLARAFAREAFLDFRTINNGVAAAAVFESWFLSERCRGQDKTLIQTMLADYNGYVFEHINSSQSVTVELISALGTMPFGKNYLSAHANIIMDDPIFTEVRDRSNANFLWFIKFERSCKETEQELQTDSDLSTHDIRHELINNNMGQDQNDDSEHTADIIQLFEYQEQNTEKRRGERLLSHSKNEGGADIIDLQRWSAKH